MDNFIVYQSFEDQESAYRTAATLESRDIPLIVEKVSQLLDSNIIGVMNTSPYVIKLRATDFEKANDIIRANTIINLDEVDKDYMLLSFTDGELIDVAAKEDEWGIYNAKLATALLQQREVVMPISAIEQIKTNHRQELAKPTSAVIWLLFLGYASALSGTTIIIGNSHAPIPFVVFPGIFGLIAGGILVTTKKTLPDGNQIHYFDNKSRNHGLVIVGLSILVFVVRFTIQLFAND